MSNVSHHESFQHGGEIPIGSDRSFCFVFAGVFAVIGLWPLWRGLPVRTWALAVSAGFVLIGLVAPGILHGANVLWMKFAALLSKFTNPIITGLMFFVIFTPMGWLMRATGRDPLRLKLDRNAATYWIPRDPPGPDPASLSRQY